MAVRTNRYSVPVGLIGKRVRVLLHASHLVVYDKNVEVARHERLIAKGGCRLEDGALERAAEPVTVTRAVCPVGRPGPHPRSRSWGECV
ncbi:hypothetical protein ACFC1R_32530 [Kitasatospora sp. NPDC056138]|uniref:Mu transposase domain-containing protein n=1 Tax=Kitasatospora sp. NPDC056138 TaxID=3345724 RepID=UPI0035E254A4